MSTSLSRIEGCGTSRSSNPVSDAAFTAAAVVNAKSFANGDIVSRFAGRAGQTSDVMQWATDSTVNTRVD